MNGEASQRTVAAALWAAHLSPSAKRGPTFRTAKRLQLYRAAKEWTIAQRESPRQMRRTADADTFVRYNIETHA